MFEREKCAGCETYDCLTRYQYMDIDRDTAKIEMERNRENAFCCGGGGGNFYTDFLGGGEDSPARIRIREAYDTGAEILAVACPICLTMLNDAVKVEGLEEKLKVKDVSEIVRESQGG
jgi:Fe-S oxidoreductase